jgi:hypothetical protein
MSIATTSASTVLRASQDWSCANARRGHPSKAIKPLEIRLRNEPVHMTPSSADLSIVDHRHTD